MKTVDLEIFTIALSGHRLPLGGAIFQRVDGRAAEGQFSLQEASFLQRMAVGKFRSGKVGSGEEGDSKPSEKRGERFITYLVFGCYPPERR